MMMIMDDDDGNDPPLTEIFLRSRYHFVEQFVQ